MNFTRLLFEVFYRIGYTPWEGHTVPAALTRLVEGADRLSPGRALDVGCGTGDSSIYLARHGWEVTGLDFATAALGRARHKAAAAKVPVRFMQADATKLETYGLGADFRLVVDNGCLHGLSDEGRDAYVRGLTSTVPSGGRLVLAGFLPGKRRGPRGFDQDEIVRRFSPGWELLSGGTDTDMSNDPSDPIAVYALRRR